MSVIESEESFEFIHEQSCMREKQVEKHLGHRDWIYHFISKTQYKCYFLIQARHGKNELFNAG